MAIEVNDIYHQAFEAQRHASDFRARIIGGWLAMYTAFGALFVWVWADRADVAPIVLMLAAALTPAWWTADRRNRPAIQEAKRIGRSIEQDSTVPIPAERRFFSGLEKGVSHGAIIDGFGVVSIATLIILATVLWTWGPQSVGAVSAAPDTSVESATVSQPTLDTVFVDKLTGHTEQFDRAIATYGDTIELMNVALFTALGVFGLIFPIIFFFNQVQWDRRRENEIATLESRLENAERSLTGAVQEAKDVASGFRVHLEHYSVALTLYALGAVGIGSHPDDPVRLRNAFASLASCLAALTTVMWTEDLRALYKGALQLTLYCDHIDWRTMNQYSVSRLKAALQAMQQYGWDKDPEISDLMNKVSTWLDKEAREFPTP